MINSVCFHSEVTITQRGKIVLCLFECNRQFKIIFAHWLQSCGCNILCGTSMNASGVRNNMICAVVLLNGTHCYESVAGNFRSPRCQVCYNNPSCSTHVLAPIQRCVLHCVLYKISTHSSMPNVLQQSTIHVKCVTILYFSTIPLM